MGALLAAVLGTPTDLWAMPWSVIGPGAAWPLLHGSGAAVAWRCLNRPLPADSLFPPGLAPVQTAKHRVECDVG